MKIAFEKDAADNAINLDLDTFKESALQILDRLVREYPDESLEILMSMRGFGAIEIAKRCTTILAKKIQENKPREIHWKQGEIL